LCVCPAKYIVCLLRTHSDERKRFSSIALSANSFGDVTSHHSSVAALILLACFTDWGDEVMLINLTQNHK
jgi:hypothetical protein